MPTSNIVANADGSYTVTITVPAPVAVVAEPTETQVQSAVDTAVEDTFTPPAEPTNG